MKMRDRMAVAVLALATLGGATAARAQWVGDVDLILGQKQLSKDDWQPTETQGEFGIVASFAPKSWPVRIAVSGFQSSKSGTIYDVLPGINVGIEGKTTEIGVGVYKIWEVKTMRPYVGAGAVSIEAKAEGEAFGERASVSGSAVGPWIDAGVFWRLGRHFDLGVALRYSNAKVDLDVNGETTGISAGGFHYGILLGFGW